MGTSVGRFPNVRFRGKDLYKCENCDGIRTILNVSLLGYLSAMFSGFLSKTLFRNLYVV